MCAPLVAAIPAIGSLLTTAGTAATVATAGTAATAATAATYSMAGIMSALSIAGTGASLYAQKSSASAQMEAISRQQDSEREEARDRAEEELGQTIREQREARARAMVAAGESGVGGQSLMAQMNQSIQDQDMDAALAQKNVAFANRATDDRSNMARSQVRNPSALEAGLQLATAGVSGYQTGLSINAKQQAIT